VSRALLVLERTILKTIGCKCVALYSSVSWLPCRLVEVLFECKGDLNTTGALLVLERTILKREGRPPYSFVRGFISRY